MELGLVLAVVTAAAPLKVASTDWTHAGLEPAFVTSLETRFVTLLVEGGLSVVTPRDIQAVLGLERQKQLVGCAEESSCLAELGGALGVDMVLYGSVVRAGASTTANLRAVSTKDAQPLFAASERLKDDDALQDWLDAAARKMAAKLNGGSSPAATAVTAGAPAASAGSRVVRWVPAMVGAASALAGGYLFLQGRATGDRLRTDVFSSADAVHELRAQGELQQQAGVALLAVGAAGVAASALWVARSPSAPTVSVAPLSGGAVLGVSGVWP